MRHTAAILALLLLAGSVQAGPKHWVATHKRFLLMEGAAIAGASIHAAGLHHCRHVNGAEPCDEHYGSAWAMFGVTTGLTVVALPATAEGCWKNGGGKFCYAFAYGGSAFQAGWGLREWRTHAKKEDTEP